MSSLSINEPCLFQASAPIGMKGKSPTDVAGVVVVNEGIMNRLMS